MSFSLWRASRNGSICPVAVTYSDADNVLRWTAERLLADDQPAYGSIHQGEDWT